METKTIEKQTVAYKVPAGLVSGDPTVTLPIEIHCVQDGPWYAVYDGAEDVEYPDVHELAADHKIDLAANEPACWPSYTYRREVVINA